MFKLKLGLLLVIMLLVLGGLVEAAVPTKLSYEGRLTDSSGAVLSGSYSMQFSIYSAASGGTALWTETQTTTVTNGVFSVILGSSTPISASIFNGSDRWLGIAVGSDSEMTPRTQLVSVGYAYTADTVDGINASSTATASTLYPLNSSAVFPASVIEDKFLRNDGSDVTSGNLRAARLEVDNSTTYIDKDGSNNLTLTDAVTGTKTLAELSGGVSGANTALSNLASVAINTALISDTDNTDDLGTSSIRWKSLYLGGTLTINSQAALSVNPFNTGAGQTGELRMLELAAGGTNYIGFKSPDSIAANVIWTLPNADGTSGQVMQTDGSGALSWTSAASGANTALSNLASVAINTALISDTDKTDDLGSLTIGWNNLYATNLVLEGATQDTFETTVTASDPTADRTITLPDLTGTAAVHNIFEAQDTAGGLALTAAFADIPLDSEVVEDTNYTHTGNAAAVTINKAGLYKVTARVALEVDGLTGEEACEVQLVKNAAALAPIGSVSVGKTNKDYADTVTIVTFVSFAASDTIKIQAKELAGNGGAKTVANGSSLIIEWIR